MGNPFPPQISENLYKDEVGCKSYRSEFWILIRFFQLINLIVGCITNIFSSSTTLSFSAAIPLESSGWQEVMLNLWNFTTRSVTSCQVHVDSVGSKLAVIDVTYTAACSHIARTVQMSGFWLSSNQLPHWVSNFAKPTEPSQQSHTEKNLQVGCDSWLGARRCPALKCQGLPCHPERGAVLCCLSKS